MKTPHTPEEIAKRIAELPEPIIQMPMVDQLYYAISPCGNPQQYQWTNHPKDKETLNNKNAFLCYADAKAHADFRKWMSQKLTLAECWEQADIDDLAPPTTKAQNFVKMARENGLI